MEEVAEALAEDVEEGGVVAVLGVPVGIPERVAAAG